MTKHATQGPADELALLADVQPELADRVLSIERQLEDLCQARGELALDVKLGRATAGELEQLNQEIAALDAERIAGRDAVRALERRQRAAAELLAAEEREQLQAELERQDARVIEQRRVVQAAIDALAPTIDALIGEERKAYGLRARLGLPVAWRAKRDVALYLRQALSALYPHLGDHLPASHRSALAPATGPLLADPYPETGPAVERIRKAG